VSRDDSHGPDELWWLRERADDFDIPGDLSATWAMTFAYVTGCVRAREQLVDDSDQNGDKIKASPDPALLQVIERDIAGLAAVRLVLIRLGYLPTGTARPASD
jgi:hypothetical protein